MLDKRLSVGVGVGVGVGVLTGYWAWRKYFSTPPLKWEEVGVVEKLNIYPIKSGRGVSVREAEIILQGLAVGALQDRSFMVVTEKESTIVTGSHAGMIVTVMANVENDHTLTLNAKGHRTLKVDFKRATKSPRVIHSKVWGDPVKGVDCGDEAADWLTAVLYNGETRVRLIYKGGVMERRPPRKVSYHSFPRIKDSDSLYYANTTAYLVTNTASLDDLNTRLEEPVTMANFRSNIVMGGTAGPFTEDTWLALNIGGALLRKVKPNERCLITTIDPQTGNRHPEQEPLKTLRSYRLISEPPKLAKLWETKPVFGGLFAMDTSGQIKVGDKVMAATISANPHVSLF